MLCARCLNIFGADFRPEDELDYPHSLDLSDPLPVLTCGLCLLLLERFPLIRQAQPNQTTPVLTSLSQTTTQKCGLPTYAASRDQTGESNDNQSLGAVRACVRGTTPKCEADDNSEKEWCNTQLPRPLITEEGPRPSSLAGFQQQSPETPGKHSEERSPNRLEFVLSIDLNLYYLRFRRPGNDKDPLQLYLVPLSDVPLQYIELVENATVNPRQGITWLSECLHEHGACKARIAKRPSEPSLPTRLIRITTERGEVKARLHETSNEIGRPVYMTLSHCWGNGAVWKLLKLKYEAALEGLPLQDLPPVYRDAISVATYAGVNFLWIDSVCIIQDDVDDWSQESALMGDIYGGAICNIAATGFADGSHRLYAERNTKTLTPIAVNLASPMKFNDDDDIIETGFYLVDRDFWLHGVERAPLNKRSWVVQERYLSPRILHFGQQQMFWECFKLTASETFPHGMPRRLNILSAPMVLQTAIYPGNKAMDGGCCEFDPSPEGANDLTLEKRAEPSPSDDDFLSWWIVVLAYTRGRLTFERDKLVAISGLARTFQSGLQGRYLSGLWERNLPHGLLWATASTERIDQFGPLQYRAPSWSWASQDQPVDLVSLNSDPNPSNIFVKLIDCWTALQTHDEYGPVTNGLIRLAGPLCVVASRTRHSLTPHTRFPDLKAIFALDFESDTHWDSPVLWTSVLPNTDLDSFGQDVVFCLPVRIQGNPDHRVESDISDSDGSVEWKPQIAGLVLRPTGYAEGEYRRVGIFTSVDTFDIESLRKSTVGIPSRFYERWDGENTYTISIV